MCFKIKSNVYIFKINVRMKISKEWINSVNFFIICKVINRYMKTSILKEEAIAVAVAVAVVEQQQ
jgi:hypothetical protein